MGRNGRLHEKGCITDPVGKVKAVTFTEEGLCRSARLLKVLFWGIWQVSARVCFDAERPLSRRTNSKGGEPSHSPFFM